METMKAVRIHAYGGPEVLVYEDAPRPEPEPGQVLIRVHAAGINPIDYKIRAGSAKNWLKHMLPLIPGWDVSGVIEVTADGASHLEVGGEVYGMLDFRRDGAYADYVTAPAAIIARKPASLDHVRAAAVPLAALAAWQCLFDLAGLSAGQTILVHGAAGGVGHYVVQLAKWKGAKVIGTAADPDADFVRGLGADEVIDYEAQRFEQAVGDVDVVFDPIGGELQRLSWQVLKKGGVLVSTLGISSPEVAAEFDVRGEGLSVRPDSTELTAIAELIDEGRIKPAVTAVFPLAEAAKAHTLLESGQARGKVVLKVRD